MIYWIEHAPNPWVRAIAIAIIGTVAYFEYTAGENLGPWLGGYGACTNDDPYDNTTPEAKADPNFDLFCQLTQQLGPVGGAIAFKQANETLGLKVSDEDLVGFYQRRYPKPKAK